MNRYRVWMTMPNSQFRAPVGVFAAATGAEAIRMVREFATAEQQQAWFEAQRIIEDVAVLPPTTCPASLLGVPEPKEPNV